MKHCEWCSWLSSYPCYALGVLASVRFQGGHCVLSPQLLFKASWARERCRMSRQSTLDAHLSSSAPRYRPQHRRPSPASSSGSSGGERGLRTIQLSKADPVRADDLTLSERRRMKRRVADIEDEMSSEDGERVAERRHESKRKMPGSRPMGRRTEDEAVISIPLTREEDDSGEGEQQNADYMASDDGEEPQMHVKRRLGLRPRYTASKTPTASPRSSHGNFIPSGSKEPIVPSSQARLAQMNNAQDAGESIVRRRLVLTHQP